MVQSTDLESKTQASDAAPGVPRHPVGKGTVSVKGEESQEGGILGVDVPSWGRGQESTKAGLEQPPPKALEGGPNLAAASSALTTPLPPTTARLSGLLPIPYPLSKRRFTQAAVCVYITDQSIVYFIRKRKQKPMGNFLPVPVCLELFSLGLISASSKLLVCFVFLNTHKPSF